MNTSILYKGTRLWGSLVAMGLLFAMSACEDKFPTNTESPDLTVIESIKIVNAGPAGNQVVEGTVDENAKLIKFPRLDPETDFSSLKFEATMSPGAKLEQHDFSINFAEGESQKSVVLKVVNNKRFREYFAQIRLNVPVFGAEFSKPTIYDYSANDLGHDTYEAYTGMSTRGYGFTYNYVVIPSRVSGIPAHLLSVPDLKKGEIKRIDSKIPTGWFSVNTAAAEYGHLYVFNALSSQQNIWHIDANKGVERGFKNIGPVPFKSLPNPSPRYGDGSGVVLNSKGNGYIYISGNPGTIMGRVTVTNFSELSNPVNLATPANLSNSGHVSGYIDNDKVFVSSHEQPLIVCDMDLKEIFRIPTSVVPARAMDARIIHFNSERYLLTLTAARSGEDATVLYIYDITKGETDFEALKEFVNRSGSKPVFEYSLSGPTTSAPSVRTGYAIEKDSDGKDAVLTVSGGTTDAGFVIIDFPIKKLED